VVSISDSCYHIYSAAALHLPFFLIRKYIAIVSYEQRQNYKDDFNAEYDEYRALHARMETVARRFIKLDAQRKRLSPGSKEYQVNRFVPG
jgi:RNA polymerase II elongation factor ELL